MVKLRLRVGPKGQIILPKMIREKLGIKPNSYVTVDLRDSEVALKKGVEIEEFIEWLKNSRKPVAKQVSRFSLEDEALT
ncbi:MAG: AbrB/MazE/SpoVT family DNA-binding domain-containing protein [Thermoproteota archaeon]|nr:AbrB/MazE/SpoVT family DNA-binding domain-containing protein [Candidatus Brockarchaeota archaeon]